MKKSIISSVVLAMAGSLLVAGTALAQQYPERPITLVIPYGPGGAADLSARLIAMQKKTDTPCCRLELDRRWVCRQ